MSKNKDSSLDFRIKYRNEHDTNSHPKEYRVLDSIARIVRGPENCAAITFFKGKFLFSFNIKDEQSYEIYKSIFEDFITIIEKKYENTEIISDSKLVKRALYEKLLERFSTLEQLKTISAISQKFENYINENQISDLPKDHPDLLNAFKDFNNNFSFLTMFIKNIHCIKELSKKEDYAFSFDDNLQNFNKILNNILKEIKNIASPTIVNIHFYNNKGKYLQSKVAEFEDLLAQYLPGIQLDKLKELMQLKQLNLDKSQEVYELLDQLMKDPERKDGFFKIFNKVPLLGFIYNLKNEKDLKLHLESFSNNFIKSYQVLSKEVYSFYEKYKDECSKKPEIKHNVTYYKTYICKLAKDFSSISKLFSIKDPSNPALQEMYDAAYNIKNKFKLIHYNDEKHAEMNLIEYLSSKMLSRDKVYIGITKLCCDSCYIAIQIYNDQKIAEVIVRGTHGKTFDWKVPNFLTKINEGLIKFIERKTNFIERIENNTKLTVYEEGYISDSDWEDNFEIESLGGLKDEI